MPSAISSTVVVVSDVAVMMNPPPRRTPSRRGVTAAGEVSSLHAARVEVAALGALVMRLDRLHPHRLAARRADRTDQVRVAGGDGRRRGVPAARGRCGRAPLSLSVVHGLTI